MRHSLFLTLLAWILLTSSPYLWAKGTPLPENAKKIVENLPDKKLNLEFIIALGLKSQSYKSIVAPLGSKNAALLDAEALLDTQLKLSAQYMDNRNEGESAFSPLSSVGSLYNLTLSRNTTLGGQALVMINKKDTDFTYSSTANGFGLNNGYQYTHGVTLGWTQSLWKNFLGRGVRSGLNAGESTTHEVEAQVALAEEKWFVGMSSTYYTAWQLQAEIRALQKSVDRKKRLQSITQLKLKRGTSEKPDFLQVNSTLLNTQLSLNGVEKSLSDIWKDLVVSLDLPLDWLSADPMQVPMKLDEPIGRALLICKDNNSTWVEKNQNWQQTYHHWQSSKEMYIKSKEDYKPELNLNLKAYMNGIDTNSSTSFSETIEADHPQYSVELSLAMPLGRSKQKADQQRAHANQLISQIQHANKRDQLIADKSKFCDDLVQKMENLKLLETISSNQIERARLEEKRFQIGRAPLLNVIQAGDEAMSAEMNWKREQVKVRNLAWGLIILNGDVESYLSQLKNQNTQQVN